MAINISKIRAQEALTKTAAEIDNENRLCDLVQVMALHRSGFNISVLKEAAPTVFAEYKDRNLTKAEEIRAICGFFTQRLHKMLGDMNPKVSQVWEGIRTISLNQSADEALEVAAAVAFEVLRSTTIASVKKVAEKKVVVTEPAVATYEDKYEDLPLKNNEVLAKFQKKSVAAKKAAETRKRKASMSKEA